jgi:hypothetical protein
MKSLLPCKQLFPALTIVLFAVVLCTSCSKHKEKRARRPSPNHFSTACNSASCPDIGLGGSAADTAKGDGALSYSVWNTDYYFKPLVIQASNDGGDTLFYQNDITNYWTYSLDVKRGTPLSVKACFNGTGTNHTIHVWYALYSVATGQLIQKDSIDVDCQ